MDSMGAEMADADTPRHAPSHMPPPGAIGAPQHTRDAPLRGDPAWEDGRPLVSDPRRVTPSATRGGLSSGGLAMPTVALLLVAALLVLGVLLFR